MSETFTLWTTKSGHERVGYAAATSWLEMAGSAQRRFADLQDDIAVFNELVRAAELSAVGG